MLTEKARIKRINIRKSISFIFLFRKIDL
jgi:hypothetical protein